MTVADLGKISEWGSVAMFDEYALQRLEMVCREHLIQYPRNQEMRGALAWCLLLQSAARAGQDAKAVETAQKLDDCLQQTLTTFCLASDPGSRQEMQCLQELVCAAGGAAAVRAAKKKASQATGRLLRDMIAGTTAT